VYADEFRVWLHQRAPELLVVRPKFFCDDKNPREVSDNEIFSTTTDIFVGPVAVQFSVPGTRIKLSWIFDDVGRKKLHDCVRWALADEFRFFLPEQFSLQSRDGSPLSKLSERHSIELAIDAELVHGTLVKPNGETMPFITCGEPDSACQLAIAHQSLRTDGPVPSDLAFVFKQSSEFKFELKIKKPSPVIYTIKRLPNAHLPIWFGPRLDGMEELAYLGRLLKRLMHWFDDGGPSLPEMEVGKPQVSEWRLVRWLWDEVPVFPVQVTGFVTTFVLPTGRKISAVLPAPSEQTAALFGREYLRTQCGYDGSLSVVPEGKLRFRMQLQGPLPSMGGNTAGTLLIQFSFGEETTSFRWKWPYYTLIKNVCNDIAVLLKVPRDELNFHFLDDDPVIRYYFQLLNLKEEGPLLVTRKSSPVTLMLVHGDLLRKVELRNSDPVIKLRQCALEVVLGGSEALSLQASSLVLSVGKQVLTDGMRICELSQDVVIVTVQSIVRVQFRFETGSEQRQFVGVFPADATVKDGRDWVSQEIDRPSDKITLFCGGRELRDTQRLGRLRLQPDNFVLIWVDERNDVLLQSMKCLQMKPKLIHFICESDNKAFDIEFHGGDLIDAVRVRVAAKFSVDPTQIQLWFADQPLFDDVMIDAIGLGDDSHISVVVKSAEDVVNLRSLRSSFLLNSLCRFGESPSDFLASMSPSGDRPEQDPYSRVTVEELELILGLIEARPTCSMGKEDAIVKFLEFDRNVERLTAALDMASEQQGLLGLLSQNLTKGD
jgi:hypothetical protein